jgi:hypothetical protein
MGLMSFFKPDEKKKVEGLVKKLKEGYGQPEVRQEAMEALFKLGTPEAYAGLLKRFTYVCQSLHWDGVEKKWLQDELVKTGLPALPAVKAFIHEDDNVNLAIRALERMVSAEDATAELVGALNARSPEDYRRTQAKLELIDHLGSRPASDALYASIRPYLKDHSDDVLAKVLEVVEGWKHTPAAADVLPMVSDETLSARVLRQAAGCLAGLAVTLNPPPKLAPAAAEDFVVTADGKVARKRPQ